MIYDNGKDTFYSNDFEWADRGFLPASTFKICNSIIALETGVIENYSSLILWDGQKRAMKVWEQDLTFREAFHLSCVPCYQQVARQIGVDRMNEYLKKLQYGNMMVDSNSIDRFWLEGESKITQFDTSDLMQKAVFCFDIPMQYSLIVKVVQSQ